MLINFDNPAMWPSDVISFLDTNLRILDDWLTDQRFTTGSQYDALICQLSELLRPHEILAWHCTRLTAREAAAM